LGASGDFLLIPALVLILRMPMKMAVGTSLLIIAANSLIGFLGDEGHYNIEWPFLLLITIIAVCGIFIGSWLSFYLHGHQSKRVWLVCAGNRCFHPEKGDFAAVRNVTNITFSFY
jgi:uncharacterized membrane protein YfcA